MDRKEISAYQLSFSKFAPVLNYLLNSLHDFDHKCLWFIG